MIRAGFVLLCGGVLLLNFPLLVKPFATYANWIPNGKSVKDPNNPYDFWPGVGHYNKDGGGSRNPFGRHFHESNHKWTKTLCELDSDGDGRTNGQELGDPFCVWEVEIGFPENYTGMAPIITHPGFCDPVGSEKCAIPVKPKATQHDQDIHCPHKTNGEEVEYLSLRIDPIQVPKASSSLFCTLFELDEIVEGQDVHVVSLAPLVDVDETAHHIITYGCSLTNNDLFDIEEMNRLEPQKISYSEERISVQRNALEWSQSRKLHKKCDRILTDWTVGSRKQQCFPEKAGLRLAGRASPKKGTTNGPITHIFLEIHWVNPHAKVSLFDGSGMEFTITKALRPHDIGMLTLAQLNIIIPAAKLMQENAICSSRCTAQNIDYQRTISTKQMEEWCCKFRLEPHEESPIGVHIFSAMLHMHTAGARSKLSLYRKRMNDLDLITSVTIVNTSHDDPHQGDWHSFEKPFLFLGGDELYMSCDYDATRRDHPTPWGRSSVDEMCNSYIYFWPLERVADRFDKCYQFGQTDLCYQEDDESNALSAPAYSDGVKEKMADFRGELCKPHHVIDTLTKYRTELESVCNQKQACPPGCEDAFEQLVFRDPAFAKRNCQGDYRVLNWVDAVMMPHGWISDAIDILRRCNQHIWSDLHTRPRNITIPERTLESKKSNYKVSKEEDYSPNDYDSHHHENHDHPEKNYEMHPRQAGGRSLHDAVVNEKAMEKLESYEEVRSRRGDANEIEMPDLAMKLSLLLGILFILH